VAARNSNPPAPLRVDIVERHRAFADTTFMFGAHMDRRNKDSVAAEILSKSSKLPMLGDS
jgi:hypothetical protein